MRYVLLTIAAVGLAALSIPAFSSTVTPQPLAIRAHESKQLLSELPLEDSAHFKSLEAYVLGSMREWAPASTIAGTHTQDGFDAIARDIVAAVCNPGEPTLFEGDSDKSRTATLLAAVARFEGHYWPFVDDQVCNDPTQKNNPLLKNGNCDGGSAFSQWQVHPGRGIVLFDNGLYGYRTGLVTDKESTDGALASITISRAEPSSVDSLSVRRVATAETLRDRAFAAKVALHMLRASLRRDGSLCEFTGELHPCPKAVERLKFARAWSEAHPYATLDR